MAADRNDCLVIDVPNANEFLQQIESEALPLKDCPLKELTRQVANRYLATEQDVIEVEFLNDQASGVNNNSLSTSVRLERIAMTPDKELLRVDWRLAGDDKTSRRHIEWMSLRRTGWHWVARKSFPAGERIVAADVRRVYGTVKEARRMSSDSWPDNMHAVRPIGLGDVIATESIAPVPDLLAGDRAIFQVQRGSILMQLEGELLEAAFFDETAKLKLHHSGAIVYGRLKADNVILPCDSGVLLGRNSCAE